VRGNKAVLGLGKKWQAFNKRSCRQAREIKNERSLAIAAKTSPLL
jgi:hypothetical protein